MMGSGRGVALAAGVLAVIAAKGVAAQENLDSGKSPAQLFASDCAICHKTTQGLSKSAGLFGLQNFLREHYTASKETAASLAAYIETTDKGTPAANKRGGAPGKRTAKGDEKTKPGEPAADKKSEKKPDASKASDAKPADSKAGDKKPAEAKPASDSPKSGDKKPD